MHRVVLADGATIAYHDQGTGPAVLLLHGFTGTARSHLGALLDDLSRDHRVIAPDLRGYGQSRPPARSFPPDFYQRDAADMAALLDQIQPGPAVVLGFSDGSESAVLLAALRPDLVRGVVAWGISGVISTEMAAAAQGWLPVSAWGDDRAAWRDEIITTQGAEQFASQIEGWAAAAQAIHAAGGNICYDQAAAVQCPVLLVNGDGEVNNLRSDFMRLAARMPTCRAEIVLDSGHSIQFDQPAHLQRLIREFLVGLS
ncbi:MAG: alpha/beta fold hydrolase [Oscillochloridaceae bacterium umkhey_bin13]